MTADRQCVRCGRLQVVVDPEKHAGDWSAVCGRCGGPLRPTAPIRVVPPVTYAKFPQARAARPPQEAGLFDDVR